jgi:hypothetical protein
MNTNERAFQRVAKISKEKSQKQELSADRFEFSLIDDVNKAFDKAISSEKSLKKLAEAIELDAKSASNNYQLAINIAKNALEKAKELGANELIRTINVRIGDAETSKKEMDSIISKVKSFIL